MMAVNPSVELYLLSKNGKIVGTAAPEGHLKLSKVNLDPVHKLLDGGTLPVVGDDPRQPGTQKVFSAAPVKLGGVDAGFVYVILQGQAFNAVASNLSTDSVLRITLGIMLLVALLILVMGLIAFRLITRPLHQLTHSVSELDVHNLSSSPRLPLGHSGSEEIGTLSRAFEQMGERIAAQWQELTRQDQHRRDMVANISHDLRTPLTWE